jgi:hypothetical protein
LLDNRQALGAQSEASDRTKGLTAEPLVFLFLHAEAPVGKFPKCQEFQLMAFAAGNVEALKFCRFGPLLLDSGHKKATSGV